MPQKAPVSQEMQELLVAACRRDANAKSLADSVLLADQARFEEFSAYALDHGVRGLAFDTLLHRGDITSAALRETLTGTLRTARRRAMLMQLERDHVASVLAARGIETVILKGAGLASTAFSSPLQRDFGDIDILVHPTDVTAATEALLAQGFVTPGDEVTAGYLAHHFHVRVQRPGGTIIEIHWGMTNAADACTLDAASFMRESITHPAIPLARVPRPEHLLLHIVIENVRDAFTRLTRLVDVDRIVAASPNLDWEYLIASARQSHLERGLWLALQTSVAVFGTVVPDEVLRRIAPPFAARSHLALLKVPQSLVERRGIRRPSWGLLLQLWLIDDRSFPSAVARLYRGDDLEELEWLWMGEAQPTNHRPSVAARLKRVGKVMAYQMGTYAVALRP